MRLTLFCLLFTLLLPAKAVPQPGQGIKVQPLQSSIAEERFQTLLVVRALEELGYEVAPVREMEYASAHQAIASGEATFMANHWDPLHTDFLLKADPKGRLIYRQGTYSPEAMQGYLIDRRTAKKHGISRLDQLKDPALAKLFDRDGDGKADLTGCNPGWGCARVINHQLQAYGLTDTVTHHSGDYSALIADTLARFRKGEPVLYYTWTPYWIAGLMVPGKDVIWLQVPFSSLPGARADVDTSLPDGSNYGFQPNDQRIIANKAFTDANPAAARLFSLMYLSANDISAQNLRMRRGERNKADIAGHVDAWIRAHRARFDQWLAEARKAAR
ncbi:glycine betaine/L-proline ABC transporter substrate-binding protein ProX [Gallaecimonas sp. GXIMD4217]|uniref:glycine betaine/L-proline ABC transporter substrate-binding protein ProX n=1 Tax=Gallaecimonas sp. GXIMD4217 TaxID=3131927 RepID=UPI00311B2CDD